MFRPDRPSSGWSKVKDHAVSNAEMESSSSCYNEFAVGYIKERRWEWKLDSLYVRIGSWWPHGLRRGSAAVRLLGFRVQIPPGPWKSVSCECCVFSGRGFCVGLIKSYRLWYVRDGEASVMRRPWHTRGCCAVENKEMLGLNLADVKC
jgi:hypothetical protein